MVSTTFSIDGESKHNMERFSWVNWSEVARRLLLKEIKKQEALQKLDELFKNSDLTEKDCLKLGEQLRDDLSKRLKKEGKL